MIDVTQSELAACAGEDTAIFFPEPGPHAKGDTALAKAICASCPIIKDCLAFALANDEYGIWGGTTDYERRRGTRKKTFLV